MPGLLLAPALSLPLHLPAGPSRASPRLCPFVGCERHGASCLLSAEGYSKVKLIRNQLTPRQRSVLLAELNAMPQDEIARQMSFTRNAAYKLSHDARKGLRRPLEAAGHGVEQVHDLVESRTR